LRPDIRARIRAPVIGGGHLNHLVTKALIVSVVATALVGFVTAFASAAGKPNNPQITFTDPASEAALLTTGSVGFTYNRSTKQTKTLTCTTSGPNGYSSSGCTTPTDVPDTGDSIASSLPYVGLAQGTYTFRVTLTLTDRETTSATVHFRIPLFTEVTPTAHTFTYNSEFLPATSTGNVTAPMQPAGGIVIPPNPLPPGPNSASGCNASDFGSSMVGKIALIQRGTCTFATKVQNAYAAGAVGVVIFNEGQPGRTDVIGISLGAITPSIPVAFTSFAVGQTLYNEFQAGTPPTLHLDYS
jgi:PA domain